MKLKLIAFVITALVVCFGAGVWIVSRPSKCSKSSRVQMDVSTLTSALRLYEMEADHFPTTAQGLKALVRKPTASPIPEEWKPRMKKVITDAWGREYRYLQPGIHNPETFDVWSLGPDGIESGDDIGNWE